MSGRKISFNGLSGMYRMTAIRASSNADAATIQTKGLNSMTKT